jgi:Uma2 family endonuclease
LSFVSWARRPERTVPTEPVTNLVPDLVVEILSPSNTGAEIDHKLRDYFKAGVRWAWVIDPRKRTARVHNSPEASITIDEAGTLDGRDVLPGFRLPLAKLFERLEKPAGKKPRKKR